MLLECIVMVLGVVTQKYKHLQHSSILQYILIVRHFVVGLDLGAMKMYGISSNPNVPELYIKPVMKKFKKCKKVGIEKK